MESWRTKVEVTAQAVKVLVTRGPDKLVRARLPLHCGHPRALLTLIEGLALWCGEPLIAVIAAAVPSEADVPGLGWCDDLGSGPWPEESALVRYQFAVPAGRALRVGGPEDFFSLRRLTGRP